MNIKVILKGTSPLLMHNPRMIDPEFQINREIKLLTSKRKKTDEDLKTIEKLEWYGGLYEDGGTIVQPTSKVRKCLINTAKQSKLGRAVERTVSFTTLNVPLVYDGPKKIDDVFADQKFHSRLSVGIGNKRVMRVRPQFRSWAMEIEGVYIEDAGLNYDEFENIVHMAGIIEGIGDNRINGYGRFIGKVVRCD